MNPLVARHPERSLVIFEDGEDGVVEETVACAVDGGAAIAHAHEAAVGADPERAGGIGVKRKDRGIAENAFAAAGDAPVDETAQAVARAGPEMTGTVGV